MRKLVRKIIDHFLLCTCFDSLKAQTVYPEPMVDQSNVSAAPDAQSFHNYGNEPSALYEGLPAINIPIYSVLCGSLSLPISISYNYSGLYPCRKPVG